MKELANADHLLIRKLTDIILANLENEKFDVKQLVQQSGFSLYQINKNLNSLKGKRVSRFIRDVRLEAAMEMLKNETHTVSEISYRVGFSSPAYFISCFHDEL